MIYQRPSPEDALDQGDDVAGSLGTGRERVDRVGMAHDPLSINERWWARLRRRRCLAAAGGRRHRRDEIGRADRHGEADEQPDQGQHDDAVSSGHQSDPG